MLVKGATAVGRCPLFYSTMDLGDPWNYVVSVYHFIIVYFLLCFTLDDIQLHADISGDEIF